MSQTKEGAGAGTPNPQEVTLCEAIEGITGLPVASRKPRRGSRRAPDWPAVVSVRSQGGPAGEADGCGPGGAAPPASPGGSALPCQNSNNSAPQASRYTRKRVAVRVSGPVGFGLQRSATITGPLSAESLDSSGRWWISDEKTGLQVRADSGLNAGEARAAYALRRNCEAFVSHYARERVGFLTLTSPVDIHPTEFGRIWNRIRRRHLPWVRSYVRVLEPQRRGTPHYHLLVAVDFDLGPDSFDWDSLMGSSEARKRGNVQQARELTRKYAQSAPDRLRAAWAELREVCEAHGLGRSELLPLRKGGGAVACYVGKYLEAGLRLRKDEWKGARRIEYDRTESPQWRQVGSRFAWHSEGAQAWRKRIAEFARAAACTCEADLVRKFGARWAYRLRVTVMCATADEWQGLLLHTAQQCGGSVAPCPRVVFCGQVLEWIHHGFELPF